MTWAISKYGWETVSLNEVCRLINGRAYKKNELLDVGKYPVLRVGNFFTNRSWYYSNLELDGDKLCNSGDLLYAWSASFGPRIWDGGKVIFHYHIWKIDIDASRVQKKYLFYWFDWDTEKIKAEQGAGTTMTHVTKGSMEKRLIPLPPLPEQKRIVAILDEAFAAIDEAIANTEKNLTNAKELFESYLDRVFTRRGDRWTESILSKVCEKKITDGTHQTPTYFDDGHVFLSSRNVVGGVIDWDNIKYIDGAQHEAMQKRLSPRRGDILLAKNGTTGVAAIVDRDIVFDIYVSLALLRPSALIHPRYLLHFMNSPSAKVQFNKRLKGVGVPNLHLKEIREVMIPYPVSKEDQEKLVIDFDCLAERSRNLESSYIQKLASLSNLKQSILQKAFSGELTSDLVEQELTA